MRNDKETWKRKTVFKMFFWTGRLHETGLGSLFVPVLSGSRRFFLRLTVFIADRAGPHPGSWFKTCAGIASNIKFILNFKF